MKLNRINNVAERSKIKKMARGASQQLVCLGSCLTTPAWTRNSHLYSIFFLFLFLV